MISEAGHQLDFVCLCEGNWNVSYMFVSIAFCKSNMQGTT